MKTILTYFRLIRWFNLVMMAITMILTRKFLLETFVLLKDLELSYPDFDFVLVIISTALMSAGGYIVNDIFDSEADQINKPEKLFVGKEIGTQSAWVLYWVHTLLGAGIGVFLAYRIGVTTLSFVPLFIIGLLWFYTTSYKKLPLVGNVVISLFTGFVPMVVGLFELLSERRMYHKDIIDMKFVIGYSVFAFFISMVREIVKDLEDMEGDRETDCQTMPVAWGVGVSKAVAMFFVLLLLGGIGYNEYLLWTTQDFLLFYYFLIATSLPLLILSWNIMVANNKTDYKRASLLSKIVMLTGICSMLVFWYTLKPYFDPQPVVQEVIPQAQVEVGN
jgi:4-hydroxybenzoate polyprenyltransferase